MKERKAVARKRKRRLVILLIAIIPLFTVGCYSLSRQTSPWNAVKNFELPHDTDGQQTCLTVYR